jgi:hypothetical protein
MTSQAKDWFCEVYPEVDSSRCREYVMILVRAGKLKIVGMANGWERIYEVVPQKKTELNPLEVKWREFREGIRMPYND